MSELTLPDYLLGLRSKIEKSVNSEDLAKKIIEWVDKIYECAEKNVKIDIFPVMELTYTTSADIFAKVPFAGHYRGIILDDILKNFPYLKAEVVSEIIKYFEKNAKEIQIRGGSKIYETQKGIYYKLSFGYCTSLLKLVKTDE